MTVWDYLALARRFRVLTVVMVLLTLGAVYQAVQPVEVWNGRVRVILLAPESSPGNALATTTQALVAMAGVVARDIDGFSGGTVTVDTTVPLASQGATRGFAVRQPNLGGQWDYVYEDPVLDLLSTGSTFDEAKAQMDAAIKAVLTSLSDLQDSQGAPQALLIRPELNPATPVYTTQSGSPIRAAAGTFLVGLLVTLGSLVAASMLTERRAPRADGEVWSGGPPAPPWEASPQVTDGTAGPMRHARTSMSTAGGRAASPRRLLNKVPVAARPV